MSCICVTQFITKEGKVGVSITNASGRHEGRGSRQQRSGHPSIESRRIDGSIPDRDEPCSLIVSLRSSHPHFFFYRGPCGETELSPSGNSPLYGAAVGNPPGTDHAGFASPPVVSGGTAGGGPTHSHHPSLLQRTPSTMWGKEAMSADIVDASRRRWLDYGFPPVLADGGSMLDAAKKKSGGGPVGGSGMAELDNRPILVREELADCVLLPGERRTFLMEVDCPHVLDRLMASLAPRKLLPSKATSRNGQGSLKGPLQTRQQSNDARMTDGYDLPPQRLATGHVRGNSNSTTDDSSRPPTRGATTVFAPKQHDPPRRQSRRPSKAGRTEPSVTIVASDGATAGGIRPGDLVDAPSARRQRYSAQVRDPSDTEDGSALDQRTALSIARDSTCTIDSLEVSQDWPFSHPRSTPSIQQQRPPLRSTAPDARLSHAEHLQKDVTGIAGPSIIATQSSSGAGKDRKGSGEAFIFPDTQHDDDEQGGGAKSKSAHNGNGDPNERQWSSPSSISRRPTFYVYYAPLGDENKCVEKARQWLAKEQHAYHEWLDRTERVIVELERKRERNWRGTRHDVAVYCPPADALLEPRRVLSPVLGELVRWKSDDGGSAAAFDVMAPSPITALAFQYYYADLPFPNHAATSSATSLGVRAQMSLAAAASKAGTGGAGSRHNSDITNFPYMVPPSFAASRHHRVSVAARGMFKETRQGAGAVVLPLRVGPKSNAQRSIGDGRGGNRAVGGNYSSPLPPPSAGLSSAEAALATPCFSTNGKAAAADGCVGKTSQLDRQSPQSWQGSFPSQQLHGDRNGHGGGLSYDFLLKSGVRAERDAAAWSARPPAALQRLGTASVAKTLSGTNRLEADGLQGDSIPSTSTNEGQGEDYVYEHSRFLSGRGLALLDDTVSSPITPSRNSVAEGSPAPVNSPRPHDHSIADAAMGNQSFRWRTPRDAKITRTATLDPASAELAAARSAETRGSSSESVPYDHTSFLSPLRGGTEAGIAGLPLEPPLRGPYSPLLPSRGSLQRANSLEAPHATAAQAAGRDGGGEYGGGSNTNLASTSAPQGASARLSQESEPHSNHTSSAVTAVTGSLFNQLFQSFRGRGVADEDADVRDWSMHVRDISSAPPNTLALRRRSTTGSSGTYSGSGSSGTFAALSNTVLSRSRQERLNWIADQSKTASGQVKVAALQLSEKAGSACATATDLVQHHGPPTLEAIERLLQLLQDTVFTAENVNSIQAVVVPLVMICSMISVLYLLLLGGEGGGDIRLMDSRGL